jgi:hypothetical protein
MENLDPSAADDVVHHFNRIPFGVETDNGELVIPAFYPAFVDLVSIAR